MNYINIKDGTHMPRIVMGCMRITQCSPNEADTLIKAALDSGVNMFDHSDIYGNGECESFFKSVTGMSSDFREKIILQSKCGIRNGYYDLSKNHIIESVDNILSRLGTDYLDVFLLHRPDELMEFEEVAAALITLKDSKKVKTFGVSNFSTRKITLLQKYLPFPLAVNQVQMSVEHCPDIAGSLCYNVRSNETKHSTGSMIDYAMLNDITLQAWSPFQKGFFEGVFIGDYHNFGYLNELLNEYAGRYSVSPSAIALAWLLRHPCNMQVILGTTKAQRFSECCQASGITLSRDEWYSLYKAAHHMLP